MMNKCMASKDGVCQNVYAYGVRCEGYSTRCALKSYYDNVERIAKIVAKKQREMFGIVGDSEDGK